MMTAMLLAGAGAGSGLSLLFSGLQPPQPSVARTLALLDPPPQQSSRRAAVRAWLDRQSWLGHGRDADLRVLGRDATWYATQRSRHALFGVLGMAALASLAAEAGLGLSPLAVATAAIAGLLAGRLPAHTVPRAARRARSAMLTELAFLLDLVSLGLVAGRGLNEALDSAIQIGHGPLFTHLGVSLDRARLTGTSQPAAIGSLGRELDMPELREVAATFARATAEGSVAYESLRARARGLRDRQRASTEGDAAANTETMTLGPHLILAGYLLFLLYPALVSILVLSPS